MNITLTVVIKIEKSSFGKRLGGLQLTVYSSVYSVYCLNKLVIERHYPHEKNGGRGSDVTILVLCKPKQARTYACL